MTRTDGTRYALVAFALLAIAGFGADSASAGNIVLNGGFEDPVVTNGAKWDIFTPGIPGWSISRGPSIEVHRGVNGWLASEGMQYLELDTDIDGPGGPLHGEDASTAIYQDLTTLPGVWYDLEFAFSPRPGVVDNVLEVWWGGSLIDTISASGAGKSNTQWTYYSYQVQATGSTTRLEFGDSSVSDSFGTFLDDVRVVPEPTSIALLAVAGTVALRRRRQRA